jgi:hypothetical protein
LNKDNPPVLVELVGLACSGKSSLKAAIEQQVSSRMPAAGCPAERRDRICPSLLRSALAWARLIAGQAVSLRSLSVWRDVVRTLRRLRTSCRCGGVHVIDEGLLHKFRSVRRLSGKALTLKETVDAVDFGTLFPVVSDIVVCIGISPEVYADRLMRRDGKEIDMARARRAVDNMKFTYEDIQCYQDHNRHVEVVCVDNSEAAALEHNAKMITDAIMRIYDRQAGSPAR